MNDQTAKSCDKGATTEHAAYTEQGALLRAMIHEQAATNVLLSTLISVISEHPVDHIDFGIKTASELIGDAAAFEEIADKLAAEGAPNGR